jgi:hypothetical protein
MNVILIKNLIQSLSLSLLCEIMKQNLKIDLTKFMLLRLVKPLNKIKKKKTTMSRTRDTYEKLCKYFEHLFESRSFNVIVNILVLLSIFAITLEIIIEYTELSDIQAEYLKAEKVLFNFIKANFPTQIDETRTSLQEMGQQFLHDELSIEHKRHFNLIAILRIIPLIISCLFMFELVLKTIFTPQIFKKKREMLDTIVIFLSFSVDILVFVWPQEITSVIGLITVVRLWAKICFI